jgi:signal recognition particle GTPase
MKTVEETMLKADVNTPIANALYHAVVEANLPTPENIASAKKSEQLEDIIGDGPYKIEYKKKPLKVKKTRKKLQ